LLSQFPTYQGEDRAAVRADILRLGVGGIIGHLRAQLAHDIQAEAASITVPVLLLASERDPLTPSGVHRSLQVALTQARLVEVSGAGHATFFSHPEAILRELPLWLEQHGHEL
jgi:pimeloyl-ACP methyl ester carboxylesterase